MTQKKQVLFLFLTLFSTAFFAQFKVTGKVVSEENIPLNKVQIYKIRGR